MKRFLRQILPAALCLSALGGCMKWDYGRTEDFSATERGLFIVNEGMFQYGNATLSYYDPETKTVENEVFHRANAFKLGDVAQSMTLHNGVGWIAVNNSHVVFAVDPDTFREVGRITNLTSPRYIHFVSDEKAYVTQIWDNRIFIVNPKRYEITGYIECPDMTAESGSTEQMVQYGKYVFVNCWSLCGLPLFTFLRPQRQSRLTGPSFRPYGLRITAPASRAGNRRSCSSRRA